MPRPDLASLGVRYRRIPVLAIGRDVYLDTRLIIAKLEELFPPSAEHPALSSKEAAPFAALLQKLVVDAGVFGHAARMIPSSVMTRDKKFMEDRAEFFGRPKDPQLVRPESVVHMRQCFDLIESLLSDGRDWVAGTDGVSLADLEGEQHAGQLSDEATSDTTAGAWVFDWLVTNLQPPREYFSDAIYPKTYAWLARYKAVVKQAASRGSKPVSFSGQQAVSFITAAGFTDQDIKIDEDPTGFKQGSFVQLFPLDGGGLVYQDAGRLVKLTKNEVAISVQATSGQEVRIHAPRWQFRIRAVDEGSAKL